MDPRRDLRDRRHARLLQAACGGDQEAFRRLYAELYDPVAGFLGRRLASSHDAEDLIATVFHRFVEHLARFDPRKGSVLGWVLAMAHHALVDHLRSVRETEPVDALAGTLAGPADDPLADLIRDEDRDRVRAGLLRLPDGDRGLMALRYGDGLRHREIAALTGLSEAAVRQRLSRALRELRRHVRGPHTCEGEVDYATQ